jgi:hypothetical protein
VEEIKSPLPLCGVWKKGDVKTLGTYKVPIGLGRWKKDLAKITAHDSEPHPKYNTMYSM